MYPVTLHDSWNLHDLLDSHLCRSTGKVIAMTSSFSVQVHSQDEVPNTKVTGRIMLLLHVCTELVCMHVRCVFTMLSVYTCSKSIRHLNMTIIADLFTVKVFAMLS